MRALDWKRRQVVFHDRAGLCRPAFGASAVGMPESARIRRDRPLQSRNPPGFPGPLSAQKYWLCNQTGIQLVCFRKY